jgi:hypothetical protein
MRIRELHLSGSKVDATSIFASALTEKDQDCLVMEHTVQELQSRRLADIKVVIEHALFLSVHLQLHLSGPHTQ